MRLRAKLLLAQLPLIFALLVIVVVGSLIASALGRSAQRILEDNYRSVLAVQRMKDSLERMNGELLFLASGRPEASLPRLSAVGRQFEDELLVQEANITERGERETTARLRDLWTEYLRMIDVFQRREQGAGLRDAYFDEVRPAYQRARGAADEILAMNQDAMVRKGDEARRMAARANALLIAVSIVGLLLGLVASTTLTSRILRPVSVLGQAAQRLGDGDLAARARVEGRDEIARLALEFNTMAERIQKYRESSLGELVEAQRASQATIDSLPDPVLVVAVDGSLLHVNRAAESLLRVGMENGRDTLAGADPSIRAVVDRMRHHIASGKGAFVPKGFDETIRVGTSDGERHFLPRATPVYSDEGAVVGTTVLFQDVTRLQRFEELRNDLVATVAHELRTPLTSLRMAIHLLTETGVGPLTEKQADLAFAAREECERLQTIIDDLLDLSRIQGGRMELRRSPSDVEALVRSAVEAHLGLAAQHQVSLRSEVLPGSGQVQVDAERIQLVFANLLKNAIRHSPPGGAVTVRAVAAEDGIRVEVADEGPGIAKEFHEAVFNKYFQVPGQEPGGVGLGLFLAREIVIAHGGEIGIESEPGRGSTLWFRLPAAHDRKRARTSSRARRS